MRLSYGQHQTQKQIQTLAPKMIQSMEILQLPVTALLERVEQELKENPVLELAENTERTETKASEESSKENENAAGEERELVIDQEGNNVDDFERLMELDRDIPDHFDERPRVSSNRIQDSLDRQHDLMANMVDRPESLQEHLYVQLREMEISQDMMAMCERIISTLSPASGGYLRVSLEDLLPIDHTDEQVEMAHQALKLIQSLEPVGIGARDIKECLLLQIDDKFPLRVEIRQLVENHLEDLRDNKMPQIQKATGFEFELINECLRHMRKLNPNPASRFAETSAPAISPDVKVIKEENGRYVVESKDSPVSNLYISDYYKKRFAAGQLTADEKEFLKKKYASAKWLLDSIEQRKSTVARVAQAVCDHQTAFLDHGPEHLVPLKMQQIADKIGVHVTTISRAVDDKWMETPRGLIALKRFFVGGKQNDEGEDVAWDRIQIEMKKLVDAEDKANPLSDEALKDALNALGLDVARRTIAKYRKKMGIKSSRQRRDWTKSN